MLLFQRVKSVAAHCCGTNQALAEQLGLQPTTFQGYLNEKRQDNLWPILPRILEIYPQISREWLYFNEGSMIEENHTSPAPQLDIAALQTEVVRLRAELDEERKLNRKLTFRLLGEE